MKGLLLNNLYFVASNLRIHVALVIMCGGFSIWFSWHLVSFYLISLFVIPLGYIFFCVQKSAFLKWNKLEIAFPMKKSTIVLAQYSTYVLFLLLSLVESLIFVIISGTYFIILLPLLASSFFAGAIFFPLSYKFADDKLFIILLGSLFVSAAIFLGITVTISTASEVITLAVAIIFFVCSYFISVRIYSKKDI